MAHISMQLIIINWLCKPLDFQDKKLNTSNIYSKKDNWARITMCLDHIGFSFDLSSFSSLSLIQKQHGWYHCVCGVCLTLFAWCLFHFNYEQSFHLTIKSFCTFFPLLWLEVIENNCMLWSQCSCLYDAII